MKNLTAIAAFLIMIFVGLACSGDETLKANGIVGEANKFIATANESVGKAGTKFDEFEAKVDAIKNNAGFNEARTVAQELLPLYESMKENFTKAGEKFEEAGKLQVKEKHKEYLETKAKEMKMRGEYSGELKKIPQAFIDSSNEKDYRQKYQELATKISKMTSEAKELETKADKIQRENPDVMEQPK